MTVSLSDLSAFLEVVRCGSVSRAADVLGITQPSVSKAVRRMEQFAGVPLLERGIHGARLTADGELFHESARRFDAQRFDLERIAGDLRARHAGLLRVGITGASSENPAVPVLSDLVRRRPGMRLRLVIGKSDALDSAVEQGALDLALVPAYAGQTLRSQRLDLAQDRVQVVARQGHPLFQVPSLSLHSLELYAWVMAPQHSAARRHLFQVFEREGAALPQVAVEADYTSDAAMGMVSTTDLLAMAPAGVLRSWLGRVMPLPLPALEMHRVLTLLSRPTAHWSPLMTEFRDRLAARRPPDAG
ncbi:LysR family transcriptional regulator [Pseudacidovorax sp. RU35E]|uniref:LysR family transcriptional regulator n=1 Tax=Pseudacidovorax sp. RU35E TaxID=1907403 RepID=UPI00095742CA|nr:LysR family transcriptional regulator [Pseudacidovorax sp. RU35E]SIQ54574.1 DNA-binding transcriptional regulator, LysR family [Pseudacidovorax sp. RU35E]